MTATDAAALITSASGSRTAYEAVGSGELPPAFARLAEVLGEDLVSVVGSRSTASEGERDDSLSLRLELAGDERSPRRVVRALLHDDGGLILTSSTSLATLRRNRVSLGDALGFVDADLAETPTFDTSLVLSNTEVVERDALLLSPSARSLLSLLEPRRTRDPEPRAARARAVLDALRSVVRGGVPAEWAARHHGLDE